MTDNRYSQQDGAEIEVQKAADRIATDVLHEGFWSQRTQEEIERDFKQALATDHSGKLAHDLEDAVNKRLGNAGHIEFDHQIYKCRSDHDTVRMYNKQSKVSELVLVDAAEVARVKSGRCDQFAPTPSRLV